MPPARRSVPQRSARRGVCRALRRRRLTGLAGLLAAGVGLLVLAASGSSGPVDVPQRTSARPEVERMVVGHGARAVLVVRRTGGRPRPGVIFLHGWALLGSRAYRGWVDHLVRRGATVIAPRYQADRTTPPEEAQANMVAGVRAALERVRVRAGGVTVVGHSAGAILAADYAALAASEGLPRARAVLAVYPGRAIRNSPTGIPTADYSLIPSSARLTVMASAADDVVGEEPARELFEAAVNVPFERRSFVEVTDPAASDHFAPVLSDRTARLAFWRPLDRLLPRRTG